MEGQVPSMSPSAPQNNLDFILLQIVCGCSPFALSPFLLPEAPLDLQGHGGATGGGMIVVTGR